MKTIPFVNYSEASSRFASTSPKSRQPMSVALEPSTPNRFKAQEFRSSDYDMAWRPSEYLIGGMLDNTLLGRVTGTLHFASMDESVRLDLVGDFHRDIRGAKLELLGDPDATLHHQEARSFMARFSNLQTGKVGDITAGLPPHDYVRYVYVEWYSDQNGRVVLEYNPDRARVIGTPIPYQESVPLSRQQQDRNMIEFLRGVQEDLDREGQEYADGDVSDDGRK